MKPLYSPVVPRGDHPAQARTPLNIYNAAKGEANGPSISSLSNKNVRPRFLPAAQKKHPLRPASTMNFDSAHGALKIEHSSASNQIPHGQSKSPSLLHLPEEPLQRTVTQETQGPKLQGILEEALRLAGLKKIEKQQTASPNMEFKGSLKNSIKSDLPTVSRGYDLNSGATSKGNRSPRYRPANKTRTLQLTEQSRDRSSGVDPLIINSYNSPQRLGQQDGNPSLFRVSNSSFKLLAKASELGSVAINESSQALNLHGLQASSNSSQAVVDPPSAPSGPEALRVTFKKPPSPQSRKMVTCIIDLKPAQEVDLGETKFGFFNESHTRNADRRAQAVLHTMQPSLHVALLTPSKDCDDEEYQELKANYTRTSSEQSGIHRKALDTFHSDESLERRDQISALTNHRSPPQPENRVLNFDGVKAMLQNHKGVAKQFQTATNFRPFQGAAGMLKSQFARGPSPIKDLPPLEEVERSPSTCTSFKAKTTVKASRHLPPIKWQKRVVVLKSPTQRLASFEDSLIERHKQQSSDSEYPSTPETGEDLAPPVRHRPSRSALDTHAPLSIKRASQLEPVLKRRPPSRLSIVDNRKPLVIRKEAISLVGGKL